MRIEGERGVFPMARQSVTRLTATRLALVGDAAHVFPPIGAQGLNLGLRDVKGLDRDGARGRGRGRGHRRRGGAGALSPRARPRRRRARVRGRRLNRSLLARFAPIDAARGLGLAALGAIGPLRRMVMREGVAPMLGG